MANTLFGVDKDGEVVKESGVAMAAVAALTATTPVLLRAPLAVAALA